MSNKVPKESTKLAGRDYNVNDYGKKDSLASGLATTHEQVSDTYTEGEIGGTIEKGNGEKTTIPRTGYK